MFSLSADDFSGCLAEVPVEERRDSGAWLCRVHWKFFGSDTFLINHVDPSSSYPKKAFFTARRDVFVP